MVHWEKSIFRKVIFICITVSLGCYLGLTMHPITTSAQSNPPTTRIAININGEQINLYRVDLLGQLNLVLSLSNFSIPHLSHPVGSEWEITSPSDIVVSPDGQHLAFTAVSSAGETTLFLYLGGQSRLSSKDVPGLARVEWSPKNDAIILVPPEVFDSSNPGSISDIYLYTLSSSEITAITNTPQVREVPVHWSPDGERILYASEGNLYAVDRSGQGLVELADLETQLPLEIDVSRYAGCAPNQIVWSEANARIYYTVMCYTVNDLFYELLYSVNLSGDNHLVVRQS